MQDTVELYVVISEYPLEPALGLVDVKVVVVEFAHPLISTTGTVAKGVPAQVGVE